MSTLRVEGIKNAAASSDAITLAADGTCTAKITNNLSNRNLIINGAMQVAQRGTSSTSAGYKTVDRYKAEGSNTGQTATQSQQSLSSSDTGPWEKGFRKYYRIALASGGTANVNAWVSIQQRVEAQNIACSGWDYTSASSDITLSFWLRVSTNQTFYSYVYSYDGTPKAYTFSFTASGNNTWTKVTKTIPGNSGITVDNDNGAGLQISLIAFGGTNYTNNRTLNTWAAHDGNNYAPDMATTWITTGTPTFDITGVQLEVGDVATEFEHRSYGDELIRCQRYYENIKGPDLSTAGSNETLIGVGHAYTNNRVLGNWRYKVQKRAAPSITTDAANEVQALISGTGWVSAGTFGGNTNIYCTRMDVQSISGSPCTAGHCCEIRLTDDGIIHFNSEI